MECIRALYGNPKFAQTLVFSPERHYTDAEQTQRLYHEMHTGDWWWEKQVRRYSLLTVNVTDSHCGCCTDHSGK